MFDGLHLKRPATGKWPSRSFKVTAVAAISFHGMWNSRMHHVTQTTPLSGTVCYRQAGTCYDKLNHQIWSFYNFTRYGNIKGLAKCRKCGGLGRLGVTEAYRQCHHSIERIRRPIRNDLLCVEWDIKPYTLTHSLLFVFNGNYMSISCRG